MKISALMKVIITVAILMISTGVNFDLGAADLKIASQNVSKISSFAGNQSIRIFQGLEPDIALLQEWCLAEPSHREYVDQAFGPDFYYYLASDPGVNPVGNPWAQNNGIVSRWMMQTWGGGGRILLVQVVLTLPGLKLTFPGRMIFWWSVLI